MTTEPIKLTVETTVNAPLARVWDAWTLPEHITQWNFASPDWHCPSATNDLRTGGSFSSRMEARDGSFGFDFGGTYDDVVLHQRIAYTMGDGRQAVTTFTGTGGTTTISTTFDAEGTNPIEMQQAGWQAIMNNFRSYTEGME